MQGLDGSINLFGERFVEQASVSSPPLLQASRFHRQLDLLCNYVRLIVAGFASYFVLGPDIHGFICIEEFLSGQAETLGGAR